MIPQLIGANFHGKDKISWAFGDLSQNLRYHPTANLDQNPRSFRPCQNMLGGNQAKSMALQLQHHIGPCCFHGLGAYNRLKIYNQLLAFEHLAQICDRFLP